MGNDMRKKLRKMITEIMSDGKEYSVSDLKEAIQRSSGLIYKADYTESQLSGAIYLLYSNGRLLRQERGSYILADSTQKAAAPSEAESTQPAEHANSAPLPLEELLTEMKCQLKEHYSFICQAMKNVDLTPYKNVEDVRQTFDKLLKLRAALQEFME